MLHFWYDIHIFSAALSMTDGLCMASMRFPCQPEQQNESPDFTEADKEWIEKIDRTQLSWDNW